MAALWKMLLKQRPARGAEMFQRWLHNGGWGLVHFTHFLQTIRGLLHSHTVRMFHVDETDSSHDIYPSHHIHFSLWPRIFMTSVTFCCNAHLSNSWGERDSAHDILQRCPLPPCESVDQIHFSYILDRGNLSSCSSETVATVKEFMHQSPPLINTWLHYKKLLIGSYVYMTVMISWSEVFALMEPKQMTASCPFQCHILMTVFIWAGFYFIYYCFAFNKISTL